MKILLKIVFAIVGLALLSVAGAAVYLAYFFDANSYKQEIIEAAESATGRNLKIPGDINLELWPPVGLNLGEVELSNAVGFSSAPMVAIKQLSLRVEVLPIITAGEIEVGSITLDGLNLNLARTADGKTNWDDLTQPADKDASAKTADASESSFDPKSLKVGAIHITDAAIIWDDAGKKIQITPLNIHTGEFSLGNAFDLAVDLAVALDEPKMTVAVDLETRILPNIEAQKYQLTDLRGDISAKGEPIPNGEQRVSLNADVTADLSADSLELLLKKLAAAGVEANAEVKVAKLTGEPSYAGKLSIAQFNPKFVMTTLGLEAPVTADSEALKAVALNTRLRGTTNNIQLDALKINLDQSILTGELGVTDFSSQAVVFDLHLDKIDVDRYLPPKSETEEKPKEASSEKVDVNAIEIPAELAGQFNAKGKVGIGQFKVMNVRTNQVKFTLDAVKGRGMKDSLSARLYDGSFKARHEVDLTAKTPRYVLAGAVDAVKIGPLLEDASGEPHVKGTTILNFDLHSRGKTVGDVRQTLGGQLDFNIKDGAVNGFNLGEVLRKGRALRDGKTYTPSGPKTTDFAAMTGTATIRNGRLTNPDLKAAMPAMRLVGNGWVDLYQETLDYLAQPTIVETSKGQGGSDMEDLKNIPIPIRVKGSWADPKVRIEWDRLLKDAAKKKADEAIEKEKDKLREKAKKELNKALPGLGDFFRR